MPNFAESVCARRSPSGRKCGRPVDHEIHSQDRAKQNGWKHHDYELDNPVSAEQHCLDNPGHCVTVQFTNTLDVGLKRSVLRTPGALLMYCQDCSWWDDQLYPKEV